MPRCHGQQQLAACSQPLHSHPPAPAVSPQQQPWALLVLLRQASVSAHRHCLGAAQRLAAAQTASSAGAAGCWWNQAAVPRPVPAAAQQGPGCQTSTSHHRSTSPGSHTGAAAGLSSARLHLLPPLLLLHLAVRHVVWILAHTQPCCCPAAAAARPAALPEHPAAAGHLAAGAAAAAVAREAEGLAAAQHQARPMGLPQLTQGPMSCCPGRDSCGVEARQVWTQCCSRLQYPHTHPHPRMLLLQQVLPGAPGPHSGGVPDAQVWRRAGLHCCSCCMCCRWHPPTALMPRHSHAHACTSAGERPESVRRWA